MIKYMYVYTCDNIYIYLCVCVCDKIDQFCQTCTCIFALNIEIKTIFFQITNLATRYALQLYRVLSTNAVIVILKKYF